MTCTDEMYQAFKAAAFGPTSDNETYADCMKNGIEAAIKAMPKTRHVGKVRIVGDGKSHRHEAVLSASAIIDGLVEDGTKLYVK